MRCALIVVGQVFPGLAPRATTLLNAETRNIGIGIHQAARPYLAVEHFSLDDGDGAHVEVTAATGLDLDRNR